MCPKYVHNVSKPLMCPLNVQKVSKTTNFVQNVSKVELNLGQKKNNVSKVHPSVQNVSKSLDTFWTLVQKLIFKHP